MFKKSRLAARTASTLALCLLAVWLGNLARADSSEELLFRVLLDNKEIGFHSFRMAEEAGKETIEINADFDVTFFAIPVYSYDHRNREVWSNGCLETIVSSTDDNGKEFSVEGALKGGLFKVSTKNAQQNLDSRCVMTFAYWNRDFLQQSYLLNAQTGEYLAVDIGYQGIEKLRYEGQDVAAARYNLRNRDKDLDITVWYHESTGKWLSLESKVSGGKVIRYLPAGSEARQISSGVAKPRTSQK
ncbi:MAG: DUF6134 family protein [Gammaproteobacteria bacterium]|nr:DUF6134 family protein [Gammaproteobacteria bacterium]